MFAHVLWSGLGVRNEVQLIQWKRFFAGDTIYEIAAVQEKQTIVSVNKFQLSPGHEIKQFYRFVENLRKS